MLPRAGDAATAEAGDYSFEQLQSIWEAASASLSSKLGPGRNRPHGDNA